MDPQDDGQMGDPCRAWLDVAEGYIGEGNLVAKFIDPLQESSSQLKVG